MEELDGAEEKNALFLQTNGSRLSNFDGIR